MLCRIDNIEAAGVGHVNYKKLKSSARLSAMNLV